LELVGAADQERRAPHLLGGNAGGDIEVGEPDPAIVAGIGMRGMRRLLVVQRELSGVQHQVHRLAFIHPEDGLRPGEHVVGVLAEPLLMIEGGPRWVRGITRTQPFSSWLSVNATQAVTSLCGVKPKYAES